MDVKIRMWYMTPKYVIRSDLLEGKRCLYGEMDVKLCKIIDQLRFISFGEGVNGLICDTYRLLYSEHTKLALPDDVVKSCHVAF